MISDGRGKEQRQTGKRRSRVGSASVSDRPRPPPSPPSKTFQPAPRGPRLSHSLEVLRDFECLVTPWAGTSKGPCRRVCVLMALEQGAVDEALAASLDGAHPRLVTRVDAIMPAEAPFRAKCLATVGPRAHVAPVATGNVAHGTGFRRLLARDHRGSSVRGAAA
eukprot:scaffold90599_cov31-Tisochrysis_lutea.AAC.2